MKNEENSSVYLSNESKPNEMNEELKVKDDFTKEGTGIMVPAMQQFLKALERKKVEDPIARMILSSSPETKKKILLELYQGGQTSSRVLSQLLEPPSRKKGEETLNIVALPDSVGKIAKFYQDLLELEKSEIPVSRIKKGIHHLLRESITNAGKKFRDGIKSHQPKDLIILNEREIEMTRKNAREIILRILKESEKNPFPVDLLIELKISPAILLDKMTVEEIANVLYNISFPKTGISYTMPDEKDHWTIPTTVKRIHGRYTYQRENIREWYQEFFAPINKSNISNEEEEKILKIMENILFKKDEKDYKKTRALNDQIIQMTQIILETREFEAKIWENLLNNVLPDELRIKIEEIDNFQWKITFSNGTQEIIGVEKGESPGTPYFK